MCLGTCISMTILHFSKRSAMLREGPLYSYFGTTLNTKIKRYYVHIIKIIDLAADHHCLHHLEVIHIGREKPRLNTVLYRRLFSS